MNYEQGNDCHFSVPRSAFIVQSSVVRSLRPCPRNGASLGEEAVLAASGRAGEVTAGVGRVRSLAFLSILRIISTESVSIRTSRFCHAHVVCQQPASRFWSLRNPQAAARTFTVRRTCAPSRASMSISASVLNKSIRPRRRSLTRG